MEKIRVYNPLKFNIGLILANGTERTVLAGSYTLLTKEDIEYLASIAPKLFMGEKQLRLEDRELAVELGFIESVDQPVLNEEEIRKNLSQRVSHVKTWLDGIEEPFIIDIICDVAAQMDLPASKLQLLQERMPSREFLTAE